jgi:hypothetical protein
MLSESGPAKQMTQPCKRIGAIEIDTHLDAAIGCAGACLHDRPVG